MALMPYQDSVGVWTVGVGHNLSGSWPLELIHALFKADLENAERDCEKVFQQQWGAFPDYVQLALINMMFNLGINRFLGFHDTIACLLKHDYEGAADHAMVSKWAGQVKGRAFRVTEMMKGVDVY